MKVTEEIIVETLRSFEFIPRDASKIARIDAVHNPANQCTVFTVVFPVGSGLVGGISIHTHVNRYTGLPVLPYALVMFEGSGITVSRKVPYAAALWRMELRRAVGFGVALAREPLRPRPAVSDFPDYETWAVALGESEEFNRSLYARAKARFLAYESRQKGIARYGTGAGCFVSGAAGVEEWLKTA